MYDYNLSVSYHTWLVNNRGFSYKFDDGCSCDDHFIRVRDSGTVVIWFTKCRRNGKKRGSSCPKEIQLRSKKRDLAFNVPLPDTKQGVDKLLKEWGIIPENAQINEVW